MQKLRNFIISVIVISILYVFYVYLFPLLDKWDSGVVQIGDFGDFNVNNLIVVGTTIFVILSGLFTILTGGSSEDKSRGSSRDDKQYKR